MKIEQVNRVGVMGCGQMGSGIAIAAVWAGYGVTVREISSEAAAEGLKRIEQFFLSGIKKGKTTEEQKNTWLSRIKMTTQMEEMRDCQIIIEAVFEDLELKKKLFAELNQVCLAETIFVSNTSSLSITAMAQASGRPDRVIGMHFSNPAPLMKLVEVTRALQTSDETFQLAWQFAQKLGKEPIATKDMPGFVENRLFVPFLLSAVRAYQDGLASKEDIDKACVLGLGHPMGPLRAMDMFGIDIFLPVCEALYEEFKEPQYAIPPLLRRMIEAGHLGFKTRKGFYEYPAEQLSVY
jgi:3-hydroxybutyryl-CoA dehydrogenase